MYYSVVSGVFLFVFFLESMGLNKNSDVMGNNCVRLYTFFVYKKLPTLARFANLTIIRNQIFIRSYIIIFKNVKTNSLKVRFC